jgi:hypothetical protein
MRPFRSSVTVTVTRRRRKGSSAGDSVARDVKVTLPPAVVESQATPLAVTNAWSPIPQEAGIVVPAVFPPQQACPLYSSDAETPHPTLTWAE